MPWTPPTRVLSPEKLAPLLQEWDEAIADGKFRDLQDVLGKVKGRVPNGMRYAGKYFLFYSNPEIRDRVIALYFNEAARYEAGQLIPDLSGEGNAEFTRFVATLAESTFDPRIYETEWSRLGFYGDFKTLYRATVNAERSLDLMFEAKPQTGNPDYFDHSEIDITLTVVDAYDILSLMVTQSPEALRTNRTRVFSFIAKHAKHFATPRKRSYGSKTETVYLRWHDYDVRNAALDIVSFLGTSAEVSLVEEIIRDAQEVDLEYLKDIRHLDQYEQIREKGLRIIAQIRGKSPSGR
jgi:hypothetical protein